MKFAFSKATNSEQEVAVLFHQFREVGYDGLQLKPNQYLPYLDEPRRFLDTWGDCPGAASALIAYGPLDEQDTARLRRTFAFGRAVGTELIVFCHAVPREGLTDDCIRAFAVMLSDLGREAQDHGLKLSLHHHHNQPVMRREDFEVFFGAVREGTVGLTIDTAHLVKSGIEDIAGLIRSFRQVIDNFHLKDFADGEFRVLGGGSIDFSPVFGAIREIGYDGWLSADEESGADAGQAMKQCFRFMRAGMASP